MPICVHIIQKGKRKNEECGVYTAKKGADGKFYCSGHYYMHFKEIDEDKIKIEKEEKQKELNNITIDNGFSLEEVIDAKFESENGNPQKKKDIFEQLECIDNKITNLIERKINKDTKKVITIPDMEIFN